MPEDDSDASEKAVRKISSDWWGVGVGAAVVGYFCGDYFAFFPPMDRAALGFIFLLGINVLHRSLSTRVNWKRTALLVPVLVGLLFFIALLVLPPVGGDYISTVGRDVLAADKRCADIQREMLSVQPRRSDLPDIFSALGCHASGQQEIAYPAVAHREEIR